MGLRMENSGQRTVEVDWGRGLEFQRVAGDERCLGGERSCLLHLGEFGDLKGRLGRFRAERDRAGRVHAKRAGLRELKRMGEDPVAYPRPSANSTRWKDTAGLVRSAEPQSGSKRFCGPQTRRDVSDRDQPVWRCDIVQQFFRRGSACRHGRILIFERGQLRVDNRLKLDLGN